MKKRFLSFLSVVCMLMMSQAAQAVVTQSYAYDETGNWYLRMDYDDTSGDDYSVFLEGYYGPAEEELVFPGQFHVNFENFDDAYHDYEGDFNWEFDESFYLDHVTYGPYVKRIVFETGVSTINAGFYQIERDLNMIIPEEHSVLEEVIFENHAEEIGNYAFCGHPNLKKVDFGPFVSEVRIGNYAFAAPYEEDPGMGMGERTYHSALSEFDGEGIEGMGNWLITSIGEGAFEGCVSLKDWNFLKLQTLGNRAFADAGIEDLSIDGNFAFTMNDDAYPFTNCPLKYVRLNPADGSNGKVVSVPAHLFAYVSSQFNVLIQAEESDVFESVIFGERCFYSSGIKLLTMPQHFAESPALPAYSFGKESFAYTYSFTQELDLDLEGTPEWGDIGEAAFRGSAISGIRFGNNLHEIGEHAFANSKLKGELVIPQYHNPHTDADEQLSLGAYAFYQAKNLESVKIKGMVSDGLDNTLATYCFAESGLKTIELPATLTGIRDYAFKGTKLESFTGSANLQEIGDAAFQECAELASVDLSNTQVTFIRPYLFADDAKLTDLKLASNLDYIREYALSGTALRSFDIDASHLDAYAITNMPELESVRFVSAIYAHVQPNTLTDLPKLKNIDWGDKIQVFNEEIIGNCPLIDSIVIPASAKIVKKGAFDNIKSQLRALNYKATEPYAVSDISEAPFSGLSLDLYIDESVKNIGDFVFGNMHITNSPELSKYLIFGDKAFAGTTVDSLDWHFDVDVSYPFGDAYVEKLTFSKIKAIPANTFKKADLGNLYLDGIEEIGESAFEDASVNNYLLHGSLIIPGTVKSIGAKAFAGVSNELLVFEKGAGLTIGSKAFQLSGGATFEAIYAYYDADHIPAAAGAFDFEDKVTTFYAGSCSDVEAYKAADGWKDIPVKTWDGVTEYKYSFEIVGEKNPRPIEFYLDEYTIFVNGKTATQSVIGCDNKAEIMFWSPCGDLTLDHWPDGTTDPGKYEIELTSDTVIRIYVKENEYDLTLALEDPQLSSVAKIYVANEANNWEWEEKSSTVVSTCNEASIKLELSDTEHYTFLGWYDDKDVLFGSDPLIEHIFTEKKLTAKISVQEYNIAVNFEPCMYCYGSEATDHFELNGKDMGKNDFGENIDYGTEVTIKFVGEKGTDYRYVIDYWEDEYGNTLSEENEYTFIVTDYVTIHPVIKLANTYAITATSADEKLGTVTMTPEADAETEKGSGMYWEGSKIELSASPTAEHTYFKQWKDGEKSSIRTITVNKAYEYVAEFERDSFDITVKVEGIDAALITVSGTGRYGWNDEVTLSYILADEEHYTFEDWFRENTYSDEASFTFAVEKTEEVRLVFSAKSYTVTAVAEPAEGGTITGSGDAFYKDKVILTAEANEGYTFVGWKDDNTAPAKREVEVTGNATYTAVFEAIDYTPKDLTVEREKEGNDERITLSWGAVKGATSYEIMLLNGSQVITTANTMGYTFVSQLVSVLKEDYNLAAGTYTINWAVRSTDENGIDISDWAYGESFVITIADAPTALDETENDVRARKVVKDGVIYILKGDKVYNALGKEIR